MEHGEDPESDSEQVYGTEARDGELLSTKQVDGQDTKKDMLDPEIDYFYMREPVDGRNDHCGKDSSQWRQDEDGDNASFRSSG